MKLTDKHHQKAKRIDTYVNNILKKGGSDADIMKDMYDYMADFKYLMDNSPNGEIQLLAEQYDGFFRFAKLLESLAGGIADGSIEVP